MRESEKQPLPKSEDFRKVKQAAAHLQGQACTLAARHISDGTLRLQFNRDVAYYMRGIIKDVEDGRSTVDKALDAIGEEWDSLIKQSKKLAPKVIGLTAGAAQTYSGAKVCAGSMGAGCMMLGIPLIAHGANNIYENAANLYHDRSDIEGPLRGFYQWAARKLGGTDYHGNIAYGTVDLALSGFGLSRLVTKKKAWRLWRYTRADKARGYETMSGIALIHEIAGDVVTGMGMYDHWKKQSERANE